MSIGFGVLVGIGVRGELGVWRYGRGRGGMGEYWDIGIGVHGAGEVREVSEVMEVNEVRKMKEEERQREEKVNKVDKAGDSFLIGK